MELRSFLGLLNYYDSFIPNLSSPLHLNWKWTKECVVAFKEAKERLVSSHIGQLHMLLPELHPALSICACRGVCRQDWTYLSQTGDLTSLVSNHSRSQLMIAEHRIENGSLVSLLWWVISDLDRTGYLESLWNVWAHCHIWSKQTHINTGSSMQTSWK